MLLNATDIYMYVYIHTYLHMYVYIYIYIVVAKNGDPLKWMVYDGNCHP